MRLVSARCGIVLLVMSLVNCSSWYATQAPLREMEGKNIRVTLVDSTRREGTLLGVDSLGALLLGHGRTTPITSMPADSVAHAEIRRINIGATIATIGVAYLAFALLLYATAPSEGYGW